MLKILQIPIIALWLLLGSIVSLIGMIFGGDNADRTEADTNQRDSSAQ